MKTSSRIKYLQSAKDYSEALEKEFREKHPESIPTFEKLQAIQKAISGIKNAEREIEEAQKKLEEVNIAAAKLVKELNKE